jgi:hypothetical protein
VTKPLFDRRKDLARAVRLNKSRAPGAGLAARGAEPEMARAPQTRILLERLALANQTPRCGAKRRDGGSCLGAAMRNGRCRMHGGASTGPRTPEGRAKARQAVLKHGYYSAESKAARREARQQVRLLRQLSRAGHEEMMEGMLIEDVKEMIEALLTD